MQLRNLLKKIQKTSEKNNYLRSKNESKNLEFRCNYGNGEITLRDSDIFLTSYPKSGNTWLRFLIANLIAYNENVSLSNIENLVPDLYRNTEDELSKLSSPRIIKSHEKFDLRYKKVIYVVRNPKSVAVSFYHHLRKFKKLSPETSFKTFIPGFVKGEYMPAIGNWNDNVISWLSNKASDRENFHLIQYEKLKENTYQELETIALFLGIDTSEQLIKRAINLSSFKNLSNLETSQSNTGFLKDTDASKKFFRASDNEEWQQYFDSESLEILKSNFKQAMQQFNYI
jgi:hypothetical protein